MERDEIAEIAREVFRNELAALVPNGMPIYRIMARRRADLGLTQQDVADKLGFSLSTIGAWETGRMPIDSAEIYAEFLGLRIFVAEKEPGVGPALITADLKERLARHRGR